MGFQYSGEPRIGRQTLRNSGSTIERGPPPKRHAIPLRSGIHVVIPARRAHAASYHLRRAASPSSEVPGITHATPCQLAHRRALPPGNSRISPQHSRPRLLSAPERRQDSDVEPELDPGSVTIGHLRADEPRYSIQAPVVLGMNSTVHIQCSAEHAIRHGEHGGKKYRRLSTLHLIGNPRPREIMRIRDGLGICVPF